MASPTPSSGVSDPSSLDVGPVLIEPYAAQVGPQPRRGSSFARHLGVIIGGTAVGQVITVAASPILTRLYTPSDFGILSVYMSVLGLIVVAGSLRYEVAIPLPESDVDAANLLALSLAIVTALSGVILAALGLLRPIVFGGGKYAVLAPFLWILPASMLGAGAYQALSYWAMRKQAFRTLARTKITQSIGQALTQIGLGALHWGPAGLLVGDLVGRSGGTGTLATLAWREDKSRLRLVSWDGMRTMAHRFRRFPIWSSGSALFNAATLQLPLLVLAGFYGSEVAGLFALGQRVLAAPMSLIGSGIANVYYSVLAEVAREEPERMQPLFNSLTKRLTLIGIAPVVVAAVLGPWLCEIVFGPQWRAAGIFLRLLAPMLLVQFVASPLGGTLDVLERQDLHLIREVLRQALLLGALFAARLLKLDAWHAVLLFSVAGTIGNFLYIASTWYALRDISASTRPTFTAAEPPSR